MITWKQFSVVVTIVALLSTIGACSSSGLILEEPFSTIRDKSESTSMQNAQVAMGKAKSKRSHNNKQKTINLDILDFHGVLDADQMLPASLLLASAMLDNNPDAQHAPKSNTSTSQFDEIRAFFHLHWQKILLAISVFSVGAASPGPSSLMILNVGISKGRGQAVALSFGVIAGELTWAIAVALGSVAVIKTSATLFVALNVIFGLYLLYLAFKYFRSCLSSMSVINQNTATSGSTLGNGLKGLLITLTNPQVAIVWVATFSVSMEIAEHPQYFTVIIGICMMLSFFIYSGYAILFSTEKVSQAYARMHRPFDLVISVLFGIAAIKMLSIATT